MSKTLTIPDADLSELAPRAESILTRAITLEVTDQASQEAAMDEDTAAKKLITKIKDAFKTVKAPLDQAKDAVLAMEKAALHPAEQSREIIEKKVLDYRRAAKEAAEKAAREAAERNRKAEEDRRLAAAEKLAKQGKTAEADAVLSRPIVIPTPVLAVPKLDDASVNANKNGRVVDKAAFIRWMADHPDFLAAVAEVPKELRKLIRANVIPDGVEVYEDETLVNRR